ncbi:MAG: HAD family phosphatase, partial [Oscillospiraceae bacterium]|nr:HAD family phosphatase [Oscillospiraceae bacterium]
MKRPKLIVSDIDGTLIPYGYGALPSDLADTVRELSRKGIAFCPASGRQYHSMRVLFHEIADEIYYISENGAAVYGRGPE